MAALERNYFLQLKSLANLYHLNIVAGDEPFLVKDTLDQAKAFAKRHHLAWQRYDSDSISDWTQSLPECLTPDMFAQPCVIHLVMTHQDFKKCQPYFKEYLKSPTSEQFVIIEITNYDRRERNTLQLAFVDKTLKPKNAAIAATALFDSPPPWIKNSQPWDTELAQWVKKRASLIHNLKIPHQELAELLSRCGNDPGRLASEINNLALYLHPEKTVTSETIQAFRMREPNHTLENFTRALQNLDTNKLLEILSQARVTGVLFHGRLLSRPEEQIPIFLKVIETTTHNLIKVQRFQMRHPQPQAEDIKTLNNQLGLSRIKNQSLREKSLETWMRSAKRVRTETLLEWQESLYQCRRLSRRERPSENLIFNLITNMFLRRFTYLESRQTSA